MNKNMLLAGVVIFIAVGGVIVLSQRSSNSATLTQEVAMMKPSPTTTDGMMQKEVPAETEGMMKKAGTYVPYSSAALTSAAASKSVLFFYANWCPTCKPADESFSKDENQIPSDVTLLRVNYGDSDTDQEEKDLAKKYQVTYQHTFVQIDSTGTEITRWNGGQVAELLANIK